MKEKIVKIQRYRDIVRDFCGCEYDMMVKNFYQKIGRNFVCEREKIRNSIKTIGQWKSEKNRIRKNLIEAIGSDYSAKNLKILEKGEIKKRCFKIKKIIFSLHKDHWVPCLIYIPQGKPPFPGILLPAGHNIEGKFACIDLAVFFVLNGYVAITYDFVGQGERALKDKDGSVYAFSSTAHNINGVPMTLYNYNLNWFTIYESVAAVDVLRSTGVVDMSRIGITGASGGGTNSFYTAAFDERISAVAPAAAVHSFKYNLYMDDSEQSFFNHIKRGLDYPDVASFLIAPRHLFIIANSQDIWDIEGTEYVYREAKRFYSLHHCEDRIKIAISDKTHGYHPQQKKDVLSWFNKIFNNEKEYVPFEEIRKELPSEKSLTVLSERKDQKFYLKNPLEVFKKNVNVKKKQDCRYINSIKKELVPFTEEKFYRIIDVFPAGNIRYCRMVFSPEKGIVLPAELILPEKSERVLILLDETPRTHHVYEDFRYAYDGNIVIRPDLRGFGETGFRDDWPDIENWCQNIFSGKNFKLFILCHLVGKRIVVERAKDILALVSISARLYRGKKICVHAKGITAISAVLASIADRRINKLVLEKFLYSYRSVFEKGYPLWKADAYLQGVLGAGFDIEDLVSMSRAGKILLKQATDGLMKPVVIKKDRNGKSAS